MLKHGFLNVEINDRLTNICDVLPQAEAIARLGNEQTINEEPWRFLDRSLDEPDTRIGWHIGSLHKEGTYGKIFKANRMVVKRGDDNKYHVTEAPHDVVVKQVLPPVGAAVLPPEDVTAHTSEALLHVLAWKEIQQTVTPWGIPRPYEVFGDYDDGWKSMSLCMDYVRGRTLYSYMQKYWHTNTRTQNTRAFLEILAQVAYILWHMQTRLRLNHRDVKVNNIMLRVRPDPVVLELDGVQISTRFEVTLIDFGFACVGCPPPKRPMTAFQAGSWFPFGELCCKVGRDLAQLIFCIHCYFPLQHFLTTDVYNRVRTWLQIPWSGGIADGMHGFTKEGRPRRSGAAGHPEYHTGIYEFLRRKDVDPQECAPQLIFRAAHELIPSCA